MIRVLLCLAGLVAFASAHVCPPLWTSGPYGCYRFFSAPKTWMEARQHCMTFSSCGAQGGIGDLSIVPNEQVNGFAKLIREMYTVVSPAASIWLGGTDAGSENRWRWVNGQPFSFSKWAQGQPDNRVNNEHCLRFPSDRTMDQWDDFDCNTQLPYVCQFYEDPMVNPNTPQTPGQGGRPFNLYGQPNPAQIGHGHY